MKSNESRLSVNKKCVRQNGTISLACVMTLVLVTILVITAIPNMSEIIPPNFQHVIIAILAVQVASLSFSGRCENQ
jgi:hypothetical protein